MFFPPQSTYTIINIMNYAMVKCVQVKGTKEEG